MANGFEIEEFNFVPSASTLKTGFENIGPAPISIPASESFIPPTNNNLFGGFQDYQTSFSGSQTPALKGFLGQPLDSTPSDFMSFLSNQRASAAVAPDVERAMVGINRAGSSQPFVSADPMPGLQAFNRFNPTSNQFEQLFGNVAATQQFDDERRFLDQIKEQAQQNANDFLGRPVTEEQIRQASDLADTMGATSSFQAGALPGDPTQVLQTAEYGDPTEPRTTEQLNQLLNMQNQQRANVRANQIQQFLDTDPTFQRAMAERDAQQAESQKSFDIASAERQERIRNRLDFNTPFVYDEEGNKVAAGSADPTIMKNSEARAIARGNQYGASASDVARGLQAKAAYTARVNAKKLEEETNTAKQLINQLGISYSAIN